MRIWLSIVLWGLLATCLAADDAPLPAAPSPAAPAPVEAADAQPSETKPAQAEPPGADQRPAIAVTVDTSETPELEEWGAQAKQLVEEWHPQIAERLAVEGVTPPRRVTIVFRKNMRGVAGTSGNRISVSAKWVTDHPDDFGMIIHEYTHVVQSYPKYDPVWLVEGIADYIRYYVMEPERAPRVDPRRARYTDGYGTTAAFLAWVEKNHDPEIISRLNTALRKSAYQEAIWEEATGKPLDELWKAFIESRLARRSAAAGAP